MLGCLVAGLASVAASATSSESVDAAVSVAESEPPPRISARFAIHPDYDRLVLSVPAHATAIPRQDGAVLKLHFTPSARLAGNMVAGHRLLSMIPGQSEAILQLAPGARVRTWRSNSLLVIDIFDPPSPMTGPPLAVADSRVRSGNSVASTQSSGQARMPPPLPPIGSVQQSGPPTATVSASNLPDLARLPPAPPSAKVAAASESQAAADTQAEAVHPISIVLVREAGSDSPMLLVPFSRDVGAAAFRRGNEARVVFDMAQTFDLSGLKDDPTFNGVTEQVLPDGMQLRLRLAGAGLRLVRRADGWLISLQLPGVVAQLSPIIGQNRKGVTAFDITAPGHVVVVNDDLTGGRLLVGTQKINGQHVGSAHLSAEAAVLPTWQGLAIQPSSDRIMLRATPAGYELASINASPLAMIWPGQQTGAWPDGRTMTRLFDFSDAPPADLHRLLGQTLRDAAATPKLARLGPRLGVAQAMLAQGMDVEAAAVLRTAEADDPAGHDRHCADCLAALASWMSGRAGGDAQPNVPQRSAAFGDSDEAALLKALMWPSSTELAGQAATVASTWPLLLSYPPMLRRFMLAPAADILSRGGQQKALKAFLAAFPDGSLDLARADLLRSEGNIDGAVKVYDRLAHGGDRLARADALERSVLVKLASKRLSPAAAAEALNGQLYAWRGGDRELRIRQSVAKLRIEAGEWRSALTMLDAIQAKFPQAHDDVHAAKSTLISELLKGDSIAKLSALDLLAIADATSDVSDRNDLSFAPALIDKLLALDLAARADPILRRLFQNAKDPRTKAELGVRLADSMLDGGDPDAALAVLSASDDRDLEVGVVLRRKLLRAKFLMRSGKPMDALAALDGLHDPEAGKLQATIMESQHDWKHAVEVLKPYLSEAGFPAMPQAEQRAVILRLARDEAEAGDQAGLHVLQQTQASHFQTSSDAALFAVLTADPVRSTSDLPRSATEIRALRALPAAIAPAHPF